jgi:hypothetical protein
VRGTYRCGLDGHYSGEINGGVTPATVSRNGERGRRLREEGDDMRGPHGSEGKRGQGCRFGGGVMLGRGWLPELGRKSSPGSISIFISSFLFSFLFSYFFHNFCRDTSIQIKLLPEIFKRGAHYSKLVIKQVFK